MRESRAKQIRAKVGRRFGITHPLFKKLYRASKAAYTRLPRNVRHHF